MSEFNPLNDGGIGYWCRRPIQRDTGQGVILARCRRCAGCIAARKQDVVGRIVAQAVTAKHVLFLTATYRDGSPGAFQFRKEDWDRAISRLRMQVRRKFGTAIKVFFAFERGENGTRRCHLHAMLMFDGPHGLQVRETEGGELVDWLPKDHRKRRLWVDWWPWGHVDLQKLDGEGGRMAGKARYTAKYCWKSDGQGGEAPFGWSTLDLGKEFLADLAQRHVDQGLVPDRFYHLPGLTSTRRNKVKDGRSPTGYRLVTGVVAQRFYLEGAAARDFARAFREAYERKWPDKVAPALPWMLSVDDEAIDPAVTGVRFKRPVGWKRKRPFDGRLADADRIAAGQALRAADPHSRVGRMIEQGPVAEGVDPLGLSDAVDDLMRRKVLAAKLRDA